MLMLLAFHVPLMVPLTIAAWAKGAAPKTVRAVLIAKIQVFAADDFC
ncbi:MAG: intracellular growth attenuator family protein [Leptolyngbyaceae cyanobacterium CAN_BIN12]|nr:intracellular growth attenuator family protein [Leptolyngbyaceae cyanobacterium CAN_BIN12]